MAPFFPSIVSKKSGSFPALELDTDYLPEDYRENWSRRIAIITKHWVAAKRFKKASTIWSYGCQSCNFQRPHVSWSEFVIPIGFPGALFTHLKQAMQTSCGNSIRTAMLQPSDEWQVLCHAEDGKIWEEAEKYQWEEVREPTIKQTTQTKEATNMPMVNAKPATEIAEILIAIHKKSFRNQRSGDYRITYPLLREIIGGRKNLNLSKLLEKVREELIDTHYLLLALDDCVVLLNRNQIKKKRAVPRQVLKDYIHIVDDGDIRVTLTDVDMTEKNLDKIF